MAGPSKRKGLAGAELRKFRSAVAKLKQKQLVRKSTDARKQRATRYMRAKVKTLAPVLEGKLSSVRRSPKIAREYREAGFQVFNNRVLLAPETARRVRSSKAHFGEYLTIEKLTGQYGDTIVERVIMPATVQNFDEFLDGLRAGRFDRLKRSKDVWAFQFYGNNSAATFANADLLHDYLERYKALQEGQEGAWEHFILYRVFPPGVWDPGAGPSQRNRRRRNSMRSLDRRELPRMGSKSRLTADEVRARDAARKRKERAEASPAEADKRKATQRRSMAALRAER